MEYQLNQTVVVACSREKGEIIARAEYANGEPAYLLRYKCADGRAIESWWGQSALLAA